MPQRRDVGDRASYPTLAARRRLAAAQLYAVRKLVPFHTGLSDVVFLVFFCSARIYTLEEQNRSETSG